MPSRSYWLSTLRSNWLVPVLLLALIPIGNIVENPARVDPYKANVIMRVGIAITLAVSLQLINGVSGQFSLGHAGFMAVGAFIAGYATKTYGFTLALPDDDPIATKPLGVAVYFISLAIVLALASGVLYALFRLMRQSRRIHSSLPGILMVLIAAWFIVDVGSLSKTLPPVWLPAIGFFERMFNWLIEHGLQFISHFNPLPPNLARQATMLVALIGGGVVAAAAGLVIGLPTLRLRGDYLAIATLGFAEIIRVAIVNSEPLGGATGLINIPSFVRPDIEDGPNYHIFPWIYGVAIVTSIVIWRISNSAKGRALQAVREDEIAAASIGIDTTHHKVLAFIVGAFFAGVAGSLSSHFEGYQNPNSFQIMRSIEIVVMVTLGGLGSVSGAILAAAVLTILPEVLRDPPSLWIWGWVLVILICAATIAFHTYRGTRKWVAPVAWIVGLAVLWELGRYLSKKFGVQLPEWRMVIYSLLLIVMMLTRPEGLLGRRELWWTRRGQPRGQQLGVIHGAA